MILVARSPAGVLLSALSVLLSALSVLAVRVERGVAGYSVPRLTQLQQPLDPPHCAVRVV